MTSKKPQHPLPPHSLTYKKHALYFAGLSLKTLAQKYGTPVYIYDLKMIAAQATRHLEAFSGDVDLHYAMKANSHLAVLRTLRKSGVGADVVSGGEIRRALTAGFQPSEIIFSGVGKSEDEIVLALRKRIKLINVESTEELKRIATVAKRMRLHAQIGIRYNPDVNVDTHPYITTGFRENKFGMDASFLPEIGQIMKKNKKALNLTGISLHIGSQIKEFSALDEAIQKTIPIYQSFQRDGHAMKYFDIGGGVAINYFDEPGEPQSLEQYGQLTEKLLRPLGCRILCEPGRILVGAAGVLLTQVEYVKLAPYRKFAIVNTGMHHLIRPALYGASHRILPVKRPAPGSVENAYDVVGPICESADFLGKNVMLPEVKSGDLLAIGETGAYGFTMANHYNLQKYPKEVALG